MKAVFFPDTYRSGNPYLNLLAEGLQKAGVEVIPLGYEAPYNNWLMKQRGKVDILHFHWLSPIYTRPSFFKNFTA